MCQRFRIACLSISTKCVLVLKKLNSHSTVSSVSLVLEDCSDFAFCLVLFGNNNIQGFLIKSVLNCPNLKH